jgi:pimeloyl-ACP methyl ester carboxylesterase
MALFMSTVGLPQEVIAGMRHAPAWPGMEALAPTLAYDAAVMGDSTVPTTLISSVKVPTLILTGGNTGAWADSAARALTATMPFAEHRVLEHQTHAVAWDVLATELRRYFIRSDS